MLHRGEAIGTGRNISLAQVQSQITILNEDFRRLNADQANTPAAFRAVAGDSNIEFRLACIDPNGNTTDGITRTLAGLDQFNVVTSGESIDEQATRIKFTNRGGRDAWATDRYLNIWVCDLAGGTLGYGQFPFDYAAKPTTDGVVCSSYVFGNQGLVNQQLNNPFWNNGANPFNLGRTATHEIGHWLNLRHIWGDANCGDDFVDDTPTQQGPNGGCQAFPHVTCNNGTNGDMFMNYMDYSDDGCLNISTRGQGLRMRAVFAQGGPRAGFINNYFSINPPTVAVCNTGTITARNPLCLSVTWAIVSGSASITGGQGTNSVNVQTTGTRGTFRIRATDGNYVDETDINFGPPIWSNVTYDSGITPIDCYTRQAFTTGTHTVTAVSSGGGNTQFTIQPFTNSPGAPVGVIITGNTIQFTCKRSDIRFNLLIQSSNACGSITNCIYFSNTAIEPNRAINNSVLKVSPNPSSDYVSVSLNIERDTTTSGNLTLGLADNALGLTSNAVGLTDNEKIKEILEIRLLDKMGNLKQQWTYQKSDKAQLCQLNVSQLPPDFYTLMVFDGKVWIASKFIKQ